VIRLCVELGISYVPYFPLASGLLTGKYRRARRDRLHGEAIEDEEYDASRHSSGSRGSVAVRCSSSRSRASSRSP